MTMKDSLFTVKRQKREFVYILVCLLLAIVLNVFSIIFYGTEWKELYTQWFYVLMLAIGFHYLTILFRLIFVKRKKHSDSAA